MKANRERFKNRLGEILKEKGITADELANKVGLASPTISTFKNHKTNLSIESIIEVVCALDITIGELFGEIPIDYKDIVNIKYIYDINIFSKCEELYKKENFFNRGVSINLLNDLSIKKTYDIIITKVSNNSMYETISSTDYIILDIAQKDVERDGLYLIEEQGKLEIRRIRINEEDNLDILLDNKKYVGGVSRVYERKDKIICGKVLKIIKNDI